MVTNFLNFGPEFDRVILDVADIKASIGVLLSGQEEMARHLAVLAQSVAAATAAANNPKWLTPTPAPVAGEVKTEDTTVTVGIYIDTTGQTPALLAQIVATQEKMMSAFTDLMAADAAIMASVQALTAAETANAAAETANTAAVNAAIALIKQLQSSPAGSVTDAQVEQVVADLTAAAAGVTTATGGVSTATAGFSAATGALSTATNPPAAPTLVSIAVTPANPTVSIAANPTQQFTAMGTFSDSSTQDLTASAAWNSDTPATATVVAGLATLVAAGIATISATSGGVIGSTVLTVTA